MFSPSSTHLKICCAVFKTNLEKKKNHGNRVFRVSLTTPLANLELSIIKSHQLNQSLKNKKVKESSDLHKSHKQWKLCGWFSSNA